MSNDPEDEIAAVRAQVEQTREELGETVEALAYKADVKSRAHDKADEVKAKAQDAAEQVKAKVAPAAEQLKAKVGPSVGPAAEQVKAKAGPTAQQLKAKAGPTALQVRARAQQLAPPVLAGAAFLLVALARAAPAPRAPAPLTRRYFSGARRRRPVRATPRRP